MLIIGLASYIGRWLIIRHTIDVTLFPKRAFQRIRTGPLQRPERPQLKPNKLVLRRIAPITAHLRNKHIALHLHPSSTVLPLPRINIVPLPLLISIGHLLLLIIIGHLRSHPHDRVHQPQPLPRRSSRPLHRLFPLLWALSLYQPRTSRL